LPKIHAVSLPPEGSYPNQNTAEAEDSLFSLTTGADNTAMGFDALDSNTTGSDNALASWIWRVTGSLNTARRSHTATLLQNGVVRVAGGSSGSSASAERASQLALNTSSKVAAVHRTAEAIKVNRRYQRPPRSRISREPAFPLIVTLP